MSIRLTILCILALAFGYCVTADAQTVQPTYVRPSKGAALQILAAKAESPTFTYTPSAIYDWSAFAGVIVTVNAPAAACRYGVRVKALGGTSTSKSDFFLLNVANNDYRASTSQAWYVRVLPNYLYFQLETYEANPAVAVCTGNFKVTITPLPIDYAGQLVSTGSAAGTYSSIGEVYATVVLSSTLPYTRIQNLSGTVTPCAPVLESGLTPDPPWPIQLKPQDVGGDGGVIEITNWTGIIKCDGTIGVFQH